jgi:hypothetical protein
MPVPIAPSSVLPPIRAAAAPVKAVMTRNTLTSKSVRPFGDFASFFAFLGSKTVF